jgi:hypothetical protein
VLVLLLLLLMMMMINSIQQCHVGCRGEYGAMNVQDYVEKRALFGEYG